VRPADAGSVSGCAVPPGCGPSEKINRNMRDFCRLPHKTRRQEPTPPAFGAPREAGHEKEKTHDR